MTGGIEILPLLPDLPVIDGGNNQFFFPGTGFHDPFAIRPGNAGAPVGQEVRAMRQNFFKMGGCGRKIAFASGPTPK